MANRLEPLDLVDFTGGLNLRRNQFQLADNESPDMLNVDVDPRGGFYTRQGWRRWNETDIPRVVTVPWAPRNAGAHLLSSANSQIIYVVNNHRIYSADDTGNFVELTTLPNATATAHEADIAPWGDDVYFALGPTVGSYRRHLVGTPVLLDPDNWSEIDTPVSNVMPQASYVESHGSYMWVADTHEADGDHPNRIRWSHPDRPDSWRQDDFLDIDLGGGRITGLISFQDHLLIFKTNSLHALYGYDETSWQRVTVSDRVGCPAQTGITRSSSAAFFYSTYEGGGIFAYTGDGEPRIISEQLRPAFEQIHAFTNVFVSWAGRRLWVAVPWHKEIGERPDPTTLFVYDPDIGTGAWTMYRSDYGAVSTVIDGSDTESRYPLACMWSEAASAMITLDFTDDAYDSIVLSLSLGVTPGSDPADLPDYLVTGSDDELLIGSETGQPFDSYYRTRWLHGGWPDRKKSWRRPTFVAREVPRDIDLLVEVFRDYDETTLYRSRTLHLRASGGTYWTESGFDTTTIVPGGSPGFDWKVDGADSPDGRGSDWGSARSGSNLIRAGSMGTARSIQMKVRASGVSPRRKWGIDAVVAKMVMRRFR